MKTGSEVVRSPIRLVEKDGEISYIWKIIGLVSEKNNIELERTSDGRTVAKLVQVK